MATEKCPFCGQEIDAAATKCFYCEAELNKESVHNRLEQLHDQDIRAARKIHKSHFIKVAVVLALIGIVFFYIKRTNYAEPKIIAVRNSSKINLSVVSLIEVSKPGEKSVRRGVVSPVETGVTKVFERPSSPPPLPKQIVISWTDYAQKQYEREISLEQVLTDPNAQTRDTLVFEITASGGINVYRE